MYELYAIVDKYCLNLLYCSRLKACMEKRPPDSVRTETKRECNAWQWGFCHCAGVYPLRLVEQCRAKQQMSLWRWNSAYTILYFNTSPTSPMIAFKEVQRREVVPGQWKDVLHMIWVVDLPSGWTQNCQLIAPTRWHRWQQQRRSSWRLPPRAFQSFLSVCRLTFSKYVDTL